MNEKGFYTSTISDVRKIELLKFCREVMTDLPTAVFGNKSLAQELLNRIEAYAKKPDEFQYMVDAVTYQIQKSKGAEIQIIHKGRVVSREVLAKEFGIFLQPKKGGGIIGRS